MVANQLNIILLSAIGVEGTVIMKCYSTIYNFFFFFSFSSLEG